MFTPKRLYTNNRFCWLLFPTKERAAKPPVPNALGTAQSAGFWSRELDCLVTWIEPGSNFMVVEVDGKFVKIVGDKIGWLVADSTIPWVVRAFDEITHV